jgi:hypothetical protein
VASPLKEWRPAGGDRPRRRKRGIGEIAFVQIKSKSGQVTLDNYVQRFTDRRDRYARMIFAVHSSPELNAPSDLPVQLWLVEHIAQLVVRLGLAEWVENKVA